MEAKKIKAGSYVFREDLVRDMPYQRAEEGGPPKGREESKLTIYFTDTEQESETTLYGEEADAAWKKYTEDAR